MPELVTPLPRPHVDDMLEMLNKLRERVIAGEFESIWLLAWTPDHQLLSAERGKPLGRLFKIGAMECFKQDLITCMETGKPVQL